MKMDVFQNLTALEFVQATIAMNRNIRGYQTRLAEAAQCQRSYFSQIVKGKIPLTVEQAFGLTTYWGFSHLETEYFLTLVHCARAGTATLKKHFERQNNALRATVNTLSKRIDSRQLMDHARTEYYSNWYWMAVHILVALPGFDSVKKIAVHLHIQEDQVSRVLSKLTEWGMIEATKKGWAVRASDLHLPDSSPLTQINHANWRTRAKLDLDRNDPDSLHYTAIFAISKKDREKIRSGIVAQLLELRDRALKSPSEEVCALTLDWFSV